MAEQPTALNRCQLTFEIVGCAGLRYTPAGVPVLEGIGWHRSQQSSGLGVREVDFRFTWLALGALAEAMSRLPLGSCVHGQGYLAASRRGRKALRLCLESIEPDRESERTKR